MRVRIAIINDAKAMYRLHINAIKKTCRNYYTKKQIKVWLEGKSPESYLEGIKKRDMFVVEDKHKVIGFGRAMPGEILAIYVDPASHKKGAGKLLLDYGMKIALKGHRKVKVVSTVNAQGFYKRYGFVKIKDSIRTIHGVDAPQVIMEFKKNKLMRKIIKSFNKKYLLDIIKQEYFTFYRKIKKVKLIDNGWNTVVLDIDDKYIIRFKKDEIFPQALEIKILKHFQNKISMPIPKIISIGKQYKYIIYRKLRGVNLSEKIIDSLNRKQYNKFINDIAKFLMQFHNSLSIAQAKKMGIKRIEDKENYTKCINLKLFKNIKDKEIINFTKQTMLDYKRIPDNKENNVVLYNDLHCNNIAFDLKKKKINGIFDFGDVKTGDYQLDFTYFHHFKLKFLEDIANKYQQLTKRKVNLEYVKIYCYINELSDLAEYSDKPDSKVYKRAIKIIKYWIKQEPNKI